MQQGSLALALVAAGLLSFTSCSSWNDSSTVAAASATPSPVSTQAAAPAQPAFLASGPVVVENQVDLAALRDGMVVSTYAEPGTAVHKGQLLAQLDDRQISADLDAAVAKTNSIQADLENWKAETKVLQADLARAEKMWQAQLITREQLEHDRYKAQADEYEVQRQAEVLKNAQAVQQSLALEKAKTRITAPFDGVVARRYVRVGQRVAVGDRLFWVTAVAPLEVKFSLPERWLGKVKRGTTCTVTAAALSPAVKHQAKVIEVSPVVDPSSGMIDVLARIEGRAADLRPGMLTNIQLSEAQ